MPTDPLTRATRVAAEMDRQFPDWRNCVETLRGRGDVHAPDTIEAMASEIERLRAALTRLRDRDWTITPLDRMDAVRDIARATLEGSNDRPHFTPEMVQAGVAVYLDWDSTDDYSLGRLVKSVYLAMSKANLDRSPLQQTNQPMQPVRPTLDLHPCHDARQDAVRDIARATLEGSNDRPHS